MYDSIKHDERERDMEEIKGTPTVLSFFQLQGGQFFKRRGGQKRYQKLSVKLSHPGRVCTQYNAVDEDGILVWISDDDVVYLVHLELV